MMILWHWSCHQMKCAHQIGINTPPKKHFNSCEWIKLTPFYAFEMKLGNIRMSHVLFNKAILLNWNLSIVSNGKTTTIHNRQWMDIHINIIINHHDHNHQQTVNRARWNDVICHILNYMISETLSINPKSKYCYWIDKSNNELGRRNDNLKGINPVPILISYGKL